MTVRTLYQGQVDGKDVVDPSGVAPAVAAVVSGMFAQTVPQNLVNLLLGGVFNLFAASVVGTRFSLIAVARSDV